MASANIMELTDANFETEVLKSDVPTLVDFWAIWCGPCKQIAPALEQIVRSSKEAPSRLKNRADMLSPWTSPMVPA